MTNTKKEIWDIRGKKYEESITKWPKAMALDIPEIMKRLKPRKKETILDFAAGSGYLTIPLAKTVSNGLIIAQDVSKLMLDFLSKKIKKERIKNIKIYLEKNPRLPQIKNNSVDGITCLGGFHHVLDQVTVIKNFFRILKPNGRAVIADFLDPSKAQRHFDETVAKYCSTSHCALFLSRSSCENLARYGNFSSVNVNYVDIPWVFEKKEYIGKFFKMHHDLRGITEKKLLKIIERKHMGIKKIKDEFYVPMSYCIAKFIK